MSPRLPDVERPVPSRPEPLASRTDRAKRVVAAATGRVRGYRERQPPSEAQPIYVVALSALGAALVTVAVLWGWHSWSGRSAVPVDDQMPRLVEVAAPNPSPAIETSMPTSEAAMMAPNDAAVLAERAATAPPVGAEVDARQMTDGEQALRAEESSPALLLVHVAGAVTNPGVVELEEGARVFNAVGAAGGATVEADLDRINLAASVVDGERLWIPIIGEQAPPAVVATERPATPQQPLTQDETFSAAPQVPNQPIDVNRASRADLETLPGIGPALAQAIVTTRSERGPFLSVDELVDVAGIGAATLERLRALVVVQPPTADG